MVWNLILVIRMTDSVSRSIPDNTEILRLVNVKMLTGSQKFHQIITSTRGTPWNHVKGISKLAEKLIYLSIRNIKMLNDTTK